MCAFFVSETSTHVVIMLVYFYGYVVMLKLRRLLDLRILAWDEFGFFFSEFYLLGGLVMVGCLGKQIVDVFVFGRVHRHIKGFISFFLFLTRHKLLLRIFGCNKLITQKNILRILQLNHFTYVLNHLRRDLERLLFLLYWLLTFWPFELSDSGEFIQSIFSNGF